MTDPISALSLVLQRGAAREDRKGGPPVRAVEVLKQSGLLAGGLSTSELPDALRSVRKLAQADGSIAEIFGGHIAARVLWSLAGGEAGAGGDLWAVAPSHDETPFGLPDEGGRRLTGNAASVPGGEVADHLLLVFRDATGQSFLANVSATRSGIERSAGAAQIGLRQSARASITLADVTIEAGEWRPLASLTGATLPLLLQAVRLNVLAGSAEGALAEGRFYTVNKSRPWVYSGYEKHTDDPFVQRRYGDLYIRVLAAGELADKAAGQLDVALSSGLELEADLAAALDVAELWAGETALAVGTGIFEVMGARSATKENAFDRFWRNARTITLDHPAEPKQTAIGDWLLSSADRKEHIRHGQA